MVEVAAGSGVSAGDGTTVGGVLVTESLKPALAPTGVNSTGTRRRAAGGGTVAGDGSAAGGEVATVTALKTRDTGPALASVGADEVAKETVTEANTTPSIAPTRVQTLSRVASTTIGMTPAAAPTAATWTQPIVVKAGDGTVAGDGTAAGGARQTVGTTTQTDLTPDLATATIIPQRLRPRVAGDSTVAGGGTGAGTSDGPYSITERAATPTLATAGVTANDRLVTFVITITPALSDAGVGVLAGTGLTFKETIPDHLFVTLARADGVSVSLGRADGVSVSLGLRRRGENPEV